MPEANFEARAVFYKKELQDLEVWVYELEPLEDTRRRITDWVFEHLFAWEFDMFADMLDLPGDTCEVIFKAGIAGYTDYYGDYEEYVDIVEQQSQALPEKWFE